MVNFRAAFGQVTSKILPAPRNNSLPNPMRNVSEDTAKQQIEQEIPFRSTRDAVLQEYLSRYTLKSAGIGFVTPPYSSLYDRIWGIGFSKENAMANKNNWGLNLLGKTLNKLYEEFTFEKKEFDKEY